MHLASPGRGGVALRIRYMTGSRRLMLPEVMSILARRVLAPSSNSPRRMRSRRSRLSSAGRFRYGLSLPARPVGRPLVHVGLAGLDELHGPRVELLEVVARVVEVRAPVEAEPTHVAHDRVHVLPALL